MMYPYTTGFLEDPPLDEEAVLGAAQAVNQLLGADLKGYGRLPKDPWDPWQQGQSCTAHFSATAEYQVSGWKGSPYFTYYFTLVDQLGKERVADFGASMGSFIRASKRRGMCPWKHWNPSSDRFGILKKPPDAAVIEAQRKNLDIARILDSGDRAIRAICMAIQQGTPPGIVVRVDKAFMNPDRNGKVKPEDGSPVEGLHIITGYDYNLKSDGSVEVACLPHWGPSFAKDGIVTLEGSRIVKAPALCFYRGAS